MTSTALNVDKRIHFNIMLNLIQNKCPFLFLLNISIILLLFVAIFSRTLILYFLISILYSHLFYGLITAFMITVIITIA